MNDSRNGLWRDPLELCSRLGYRLHTLFLAWTYPFASFGKGVRIHRSCDLKKASAKYISIGDRVLIERNTWFNVPEASKDRAVIILEDDVKFQRGCIISGRNAIHIGQNSMVGPSAFITDHLHAFEDVTTPIANQGITPGGTIRIEEGCWIGFGAAIVCSEGELVVGRNSVIGSNSLVTRSVLPYSVVVGNPARIVKRYDPLSKRWVLGAGSTSTPATVLNPG